jgi:hypothetical protein
MTDPVPQLGPCQPWCDAADIAEMAPIDLGDVGTGLLDDVALEASMSLFEISGRLWSGECGPVKVRPCRQTCNCWGASSASLGLGPWYWTSSWFGGSNWRNECGDTCGCGPLSRIKLAGFPVREISEVKIDGQVLDPSGYKLIRWRFLNRMSSVINGVVHEQLWPACQDLSLNDDQPGTLSVTYKYGQDPPPIAVRAAGQLAAQLFLAQAGQPCQLPAGVSRATRQGITVERGLLVNWLDPTKPTGLVALDTFLRAYAGKIGRRRPAVFSPDMQQYAQRDV